MSMKEIVTKAIIGKSKKDYKNTYTVEVEKDPSTVLGCWIINHKFQAKEEGKTINLEVEKTLGIEIIGDAKVRIAEVEGEEEWDNVEEEEEIKVDPNYINTNVIK